jgi:hypothetical protein
MTLLSSVRRIAAVSLPLLALPLLTQGCSGASRAAAEGPRPEVLSQLVSPVQAQKDVKYLASDSLGGRLSGTPGADSAAAYIARRFAELGLQQPQGGWFQEFTLAPENQGVQKSGIAGRTARNVVGLLPGSDPARRNEMVIVGAHYDHLGGGWSGSRDPDRAGTPHNGADDNASGVAAMLNVAARLALARPARTIVFVAFAGEEFGLLGSAHYVRQPVAANANALAMVNFDMVGRLKNDKLIVYGTGTAAEFPALLDSLNVGAKFDLRPVSDGYGPSDQTSFYAVKMPVLHFFTDLHEDYHRTTDDADRLNVPGLVKVAEFASGAVLAIAGREGRLTFVDQPPPQATAAAPGQARAAGYGAYLGSVPDMAGDVVGVRLSGVRAGSPAEAGGMQRDDVIRRIGEYPVDDLQGMTDALRNYKPGDAVDILVERGGQPVTLKITLGRRGG